MLCAFQTFSPDAVLDDLRAAVLAAPADDRPRLDFARRLEQIGETDWAALVRHQLRRPTARLSLPGSVVGVTTARVVFRRGFVDEVRFSGRDVPRLGTVFATHPVRVLSVSETGLRVDIEFGVPRGFRHAPTAHWVVTAERRRWRWQASPRTVGCWHDRARLAENLDGWLAEELWRVAR